MDSQIKLRFLDKINTWLSYLNGAIIIGVMAVVTIDILSREILNSPIPYVDEFSGFALIYVCFLGAAWVLGREGHVSVDILVDMLSPEASRSLSIATSIAASILCLILTCFGFAAAYDVYKRGVYVDIGIFVPVFPLILVMPVGYLLLFLQFLKRAWGFINASEKAFDEARQERRQQ